MASLRQGLAIAMAWCSLGGCAAPWTPAMATYAIQANYVVSSDTSSVSDWNSSLIGVYPNPIPQLDGDSDVVAAVVDTGVDPNQRDLKSRLLPMIDLIGPDQVDINGISADYNGRDGNGHGTHVAGLVLNTIGPLNSIDLLPIKAINHTGIGDDSTIAEGIHRAVDWRDPSNPYRRVRVINLSVGGTMSSQVLKDALDYATTHDVLVVVAAGNRQRDVDYPAAFPTAFAVSALTRQDELASYSNRGHAVAISAPGGDGDAAISSTWPTYLTADDLEKGVMTPHRYGEMIGTSMAAPQVTGAAALLFADDPSLTAAQVRVRLQAGSDNMGPIGPNGYFGVGCLNVPAALAKGAGDAP